MVLLLLWLLLLVLLQPGGCAAAVAGRACARACGRVPGRPGRAYPAGAGWLCCGKWPLAQCEWRPALAGLDASLHGIRPWGRACASCVDARLLIAGAAMASLCCDGAGGVVQCCELRASMPPEHFPCTACLPTCLAKQLVWLRAGAGAGRQEAHAVWASRLVLRTWCAPLLFPRTASNFCVPVPPQGAWPLRGLCLPASPRAPRPRAARPLPALPLARPTAS